MPQEPQSEVRIRPQETDRSVWRNKVGGSCELAQGTREMLSWEFGHVISGQ